MVKLKKDKLLKELEQIAEDSESLAAYEDLALELFEDKNPLTIIAALLKHRFSDQLNEGAYKRIEETKNGRNTPPGGRANTRSSSSGPAEFGTTRLFLTTGRKDGANPGKILNMIDTEFGVPGDNVGRIDIMDSYSFISVPLKEAEMILDAFKEIKQSGGFATVRVERASEDKNADRYPKNKGKGSKPRGGKKPNHKDTDNSKSNFFKKKKRS